MPLAAAAVSLGTALLHLAVFALGAYLSIRMLAALYRIVDLWYAIGEHYARVLRGVLGWGAAILAGVLWLEGPQRTAFVAGLLAYLLFYLSLFPLRLLLLRALELRSSRR